MHLRSQVILVGPGDIKYKDLSGPDGVPDGIINELDRTILGGSLPRYQYGGNINVEYKKFDFGITFQGVGEQNFYLSQNFIRPFQESWLSPSTVYAHNYWSTYNTQQQNQNARYPRLLKMQRETITPFLIIGWLTGHTSG